MDKKDLSFVYGCIIGDGCLRLSKDNSIQLSIKHSSVQKEYLNYKSSILNRIFNSLNLVKDINNSGYPGCQYTIGRTKELRPIYNLFYPKGKKEIVNPKIINNLTPEALALWWMDDGSLSMKIKKSTGKIEARQGFINTYLPLEDNLYLIELLNNQFNLNLKNVKDRKAYRIRLNTTDCKELIKIVKSYIHPIFNYKIDMQYK